MDIKKEFEGFGGDWAGRLKWLPIVPILVFADQFTKAMILDSVGWGQRITVIKNFFHITLVKNDGVAFGMFSDLPIAWKVPFLSGLAILALALVVLFSLRLKPKEWVAQLGLHMVLAGAIGNLVDRFARGWVTDFILFSRNGWSFPAFNLADSAIVCGVSLLIIDILFFQGKREAALAKDPAADALAAAADIDLMGTQPIDESSTFIKPDEEETD